MFYDVDQAMRAVEEEPSLIFELIKEGHIDLVDKLLKRKKVDINTCDDAGNSVLVRSLRHGDYDGVLNHMGNKDWDVNHQNLDGNTFAHYLVSINYVNVMEIIKKLTRNKDFLPNIKNNKGETILDKSINDNYIYTTVKILEDSRFDNIDVVSFKNLYDTYIKSNRYGKYSKINNLEVILDSLTDKDLLPRMKKLVGFIQNNFDKIKEEVLTSQKSVYMDSIINRVLKEDNA